MYGIVEGFVFLTAACDTVVVMLVALPQFVVAQALSLHFGCTDP